MQVCFSGILQNSDNEYLILINKYLLISSILDDNRQADGTASFQATASSTKTDQESVR